MDILHANDLPTIILTLAAVLVPELLPGFGRRKAIMRLVILVSFCFAATLTAHLFQQVDAASAFTRAFLIAVTARLSLLLNHITESVLQIMRDIRAAPLSPRRMADGASGQEGRAAEPPSPSQEEGGGSAAQKEE